MKQKINGAILLLMGIMLSFAACDKNTEPETGYTFPGVKQGNVAIYTRIMNTEGRSGVGYLQLIDNVDPQSLTNAHAVQVPFGAPPKFYGNDIFTLPDFSATGSLALTKWTRRTNGSLVRNGELLLPPQSLGMEIGFVSPTKAYVATFIGKLIVFNPETMQQTGEIDLSSYADPSIPVPLFGGLLVHEEQLYVSIIQAKQTFEPATAPWVEIAIIDTRTDKVKKVIKESESGLAFGPYQYSESAFVDENGDIYMTCSGAYGMSPAYKTGILRIRKGASDFDPEYKWVFNDQAIEGDPNKGSWLEIVTYAGGGKLYGVLEVPAYRQNPNMLNWWTDYSSMAVEIDLYNKTIKRLDLPLSTCAAPSIGRYRNLVMFGNDGRSGNGLFSYDTTTGQASREPVIRTEGKVVGFHVFK